MTLIINDSDSPAHFSQFILPTLPVFIIYDK